MIRCALAVAVAAMTLCVVSTAAQAQRYVNLRDADIRAYIQDVARTTGRTIVIDARVQGKVTVLSDRPLSNAEYFEVFLSTLRANGYTVVQQGRDILRVVPSETAAQQPAAGAPGSGNRFVTQVVPLTHLDATAAIETVRPLASKDGIVSASRSGGAVVVVDFADNAQRIRALLQQIDQDRRAYRFIPLRNARAREVASALSDVVRSGDAAGARQTVTVTALDSANAVVLRADPQQLAGLLSLIEQIDSRSQAAGAVRVFYLQHADARQVLPVLVNALQATAPGEKDRPAPTKAATEPGSSAPAAEAISTVAGRGGIARFDGANALVVTGPADVQRMVEDVLRQLDTRREQVLVEAIIAEISDGAAKQLGVQYLLGGLPGSGIPFVSTNYSNAAPNLLTIAGAVGARKLETTTTTINGSTVTTSNNSPARDTLEQAAIASLLGTRGGTAGGIIEIGNDALFAGVINAVKSDNQSNILSTPSIMTLDNQEAKILVGQEVPITTGQALSQNFDNRFRTIERQDVGVQLEVRPQIGAGGTIKLFIRQEVSSIAGPVSNRSDDLILNKREIETTITVDDGQIVALGGLIDDSRRRSAERVPVLGDLPGVGVLFRSTARTAQRTNLVVFIRPTVVRGANDARSIVERNLARMRSGLIGVNGPEPSIDQILQDYWQSTPKSEAKAP
jgi:general secretion pathway protein D